MISSLAFWSTSTYCAELREELLRVLDRVALRELVGLAEDLAVLVVDEDRLATTSTRRRGR